MNVPDDIAIRRMRFDAARVEEWLALLSDTERARYDGFPVEKRRREFLLGRVALRTLLSDRVGEPPAAFHLHVTEDGALELPNWPLYVSITHAEDRAVAAVAEQRVGVDLERIAERNPEVERFLLHPDEQPLLETLPMDRGAAFILCWTLKEAALKALGTGMLRSPKKVRIDVDARAQTAAIRVWDGSEWQAQFERWDAFFLTVAYGAKAPSGDEGA